MNAYVVAEGYDGAFLLASPEVVTVSDLIIARNTEEEYTDEQWAGEIGIETRDNTFLWALLVGIDAPSPVKKNEFTYLKSSRSNKKWKTVSTTIKRSLKFADLSDAYNGMFTILEKTNGQSNLHWRRDAEKRIRVGEMFAILSPQYQGKLRSGASLVSTDRAIEKLSAPALPTRMLFTNHADNGVKYFIVKGKVIRPVVGSTPVVWRTKCNSDACDRLCYSDNQEAICACFHQASRNTSDMRSTILRFTFQFRDDQPVKETQVVKNFTSLRTSNVFFENGAVNMEYKRVSEQGAIDQLIIKKFKKTLNYVNQNDGWTIVGWYMRAAKEEEDKEEEDEHALHQNVNINVAYLYPSKDLAIPMDCLITKKEVNDFLDQRTA